MTEFDALDMTPYGSVTKVYLLLPDDLDLPPPDGENPLAALGDALKAHPGKPAETHPDLLAGRTMLNIMPMITIRWTGTAFTATYLRNNQLGHPTIDYLGLGDFPVSVNLSGTTGNMEFSANNLSDLIVAAYYLGEVITAWLEAEGEKARAILRFHGIRPASEPLIQLH